MNDRFDKVARFCLGLAFSALLLGVQTAGAQDTMRVTKQNLPEVLKIMEESTKPGTKAGEYAVVTDAKATGNTFRVSYIIDVPGYQLTAADAAPEDVANEARSMCAIANLKKLMKYGAVFERVYRNKQGAVVYEFKVDRKRCKKLG